MQTARGMLPPQPADQPATPDEATARGQDRPIRVLLVDDELHNLRAATRLLRRRDGIEVVGVASAGEARQQLALAPFDVALVDEHLAIGSSGRDLLAEIRRSWPRIRRVLWTGTSIDGAPEEAHTVLSKPFTLDELHEAVFGEPAPPTA